jgi:cation/acetate symporter
VPQLHGAALTIRITTGLPSWVGSVAVVIVVCLTVVAGGMRSITFVQAFQYWLKLTALAVPILFIIFVLAGQGAPALSPPAVNPTGLAPAGLYQNVSLLVALLFGTLGLPHVLVRFYTNPDGQSARRTTLIVLGLLSVFYLFPTAYGLVSRMFAPGLASASQADAMVLLLPGKLVGGTAGDLLSALVVAGAFAAFLSTTSGLVVSLAGVISQDVLGGGVDGFRLAAVISAVVPLGFAFTTGSLALAGSVGLVFAFTASTVCPVLLLGIWWRGLTDAGAIAGMVTGGVLCGGAMIAGALAGTAGIPPWLAQPAAWTVPAAFTVMVIVSRATVQRIPKTMPRVMTRLHTPERPLSTER